MPQALLIDLRERVVAFVEAGNSCSEAARHSDTSASFAVKLMSLYLEAGSAAARPNGGKRHGKLNPSEGFLLAFVKRSPDVTMPELAAKLSAEKSIEVAPQSLSRWLIKKGFSFKKNFAGERAGSPLEVPAKGRRCWELSQSIQINLGLVAARKYCCETNTG